MPKLHADDPRKCVVVSMAPSVRVTICDAVGLPEGAPLRNMEGELVTALRRLGFDYVFDTSFGADLTIMEEGTELLTRFDIPYLRICVPVVRTWRTAAAAARHVGRCVRLPQTRQIQMTGGVP
jgi:iron only hydrogenase large subunit-like protein